MIYDCFIFNNELDLLELRLHYLTDKVDKFVLVESERTMAGESKELYYKKNQHRFKEFENKIIHLVAPVNALSVWDYEFFQRNYIKEALHQCVENDIIIITDVDEILNLNAILVNKKLSFPSLIEIKMFYYFLNIKINHKWNFPLICYWKQIKNKDIGSRVTYSTNITPNILIQNGENNGWHFSYLYGNNIELYQDKIKSFTHQEFNNSYFLNIKRIYRCITFKTDLFERPSVKLTQNDNDVLPLAGYIKATPFEKLMYEPPSLIHYFRPINIYFILHNKIYKRNKYLLRNFIKRLYNKLK